MYVIKTLLPLISILSVAEAEAGDGMNNYSINRHFVDEQTKMYIPKKITNLNHCSRKELNFN